jgi:hypothetical protein
MGAPARQSKLPAGQRGNAQCPAARRIQMGVCRGGIVANDRLGQRFVDQRFGPG